MTTTVNTADSPTVVSSATAEAPAPPAATPAVATASDASPAVATPADSIPASSAQWRQRLGLLRQQPLTRALTEQTLTGPGGVLVAVLLISPGVLLDLVTDGTFGAPSTVAFLLASTAAALVVRRRALATAAVLPPLLFAAAITTLAWFNGTNAGLRETVLDAGTTLALTAPTLFAGTALVLLVVLGRLLWGLARHRS